MAPKTSTATAKTAAAGAAGTGGGGAATSGGGDAGGTSDGKQTSAEAPLVSKRPDPHATSDTTVPEDHDKDRVRPILLIESAPYACDLQETSVVEDTENLQKLEDS